MSKYSIIIPIHNEIKSIPILLITLHDYNKKGHQIIIIDDGSTDGSTELLRNSNIIDLIIIKKNEGKGYAIKQGIKRVINKKIIIFDGDLELNSSEISRLMILNRKNKVNCVMGYRFKYSNPLKSNFDWGNFIFTSFFNIMFNSCHKDILCCAKSFYSDDIKPEMLKSDRFDIDIELSSILTINNNSIKIHHVPLTYNRRTVKEGKKLKISDGWDILGRIIKMMKYL